MSDGDIVPMNTFILLVGGPMDGRTAVSTNPPAETLIYDDTERSENYLWFPHDTDISLATPVSTIVVRGKYIFTESHIFTESPGSYDYYRWEPDAESS